MSREHKGAPRIAVLGNFSGRNAGDNAILGNLIEDISSAYPDVEFLVPTLNAGYVREAFGRYSVTALGLMPWNGALKIFGLPTLRAMLGSDLVLITDNILFDRKFFNPTFNYLSTISLIAPLCRQRGIPVVLYNASVGPITSERGRAALQRVLDAGPIGIVRDTRSRDHFQELGLRCPELVMGADCALNTRPPAEPALDALMDRLGLGGAGRDLLAVNVNSYIDSWQRQGSALDRDRFISTIAAVVSAVSSEFDSDVVLLVTQVMDGGITENLRQKISAPRRAAVVSNPKVNYSDIAGILARVKLLVAMRTHAMILAAAVGTPMVNINAYPKSRGFLETIDMDSWSLDVDKITKERLMDLVRRAWLAETSTRARLTVEVFREQAKAKAAVPIIGRLLGLEAVADARTARGG